MLVDSRRLASTEHHQKPRGFMPSPSDVIGRQLVLGGIAASLRRCALDPERPLWTG